MSGLNSRGDAGRERAPGRAVPRGGEREDEDLRVDERDTMFARMARVPGTASYRDTYGRRPDLERIDDRIRRLPPLLDPRGRYHDPELCRDAARFFDSIPGIVPDPGVVAAWKDRLGSARDRDRALRRMFLELGAVAAGFAPLDRRYVYTVKGRLDEDYGRVIRLDHPTALVFLVEMDHDAMRRAPRAAAIRESARQYYRAAVIARTAAAILEALGHRAKAHYDAHYEVLLVPLAVRAGLGELGRNNILVADRYGSRVRIGAVTTDCPVRWDEPVDLGVRAFCGFCRKCARSCPSRALSLGEPETIRGATKWGTNVERCYAFWRHAGTDCGICMAVCPFSHRNHAFHNLVRRLVRLDPLLARLLFHLDEVFYPGPPRSWTGPGGGPGTSSTR